MERWAVYAFNAFYGATHLVVTPQALYEKETFRLSVPGANLVDSVHWLPYAAGPLFALALRRWRRRRPAWILLSAAGVGATYAALGAGAGASSIPLYLALCTLNGLAFECGKVVSDEVCVRDEGTLERGWVIALVAELAGSALVAAALARWELRVAFCMCAALAPLLALAAPLFRGGSELEGPGPAADRGDPEALPLLPEKRGREGMAGFLAFVALHELLPSAGTAALYVYADALPHAWVAGASIAGKVAGVAAAAAHARWGPGRERAAVSVACLAAGASGLVDLGAVTGACGTGAGLAAALALSSALCAAAAQVSQIALCAPAARAFDHVGYELSMSAWNGICFGAHYAHAGTAWAWGVRVGGNGRAIVPPSFVGASSALAVVPAALAPWLLRGMGGARDALHDLA